MKTKLELEHKNDNSYHLFDVRYQLEMSKVARFYQYPFIEQLKNKVYLIK
jgi:hypothetical protein